MPDDNRNMTPGLSPTEPESPADPPPLQGSDPEALPIASDLPDADAAPINLPGPAPSAPGKTDQNQGR